MYKGRYRDMHMNMKFIVLVLAVAGLGCSSSLPLKAQADFEAGKKPRNVILMIGDGMGISQLSSAYYFQEDTIQTDRSKYEEPSFSRISYIGLMKTSSGAEAVTQSSAAATAMATGHKTYNLAIGVDLDTIPREERDISTVTVSISRENFLKAREIIKSCRKEILQLAQAENDPEKVYHVNMQMIPIGNCGEKKD